jgi:CheY-like chemotaxis protein
MDKLLIMLVDDDVMTNQFNTLVIKKMHPETEIIGYTNASDAINYLKDNSKTMPEIIFLDLNMPVMNGWDFMEEYQKLGLDAEVVVLTSSKEESDKDKSRSYSKISGFELKPLSLDRLKNLAKKWIS